MVLFDTTDEDLWVETFCFQIKPHYHEFISSDNLYVKYFIIITVHVRYVQYYTHLTCMHNLFIRVDLKSLGSVQVPYIRITYSNLPETTPTNIPVCKT